MAVCAFDLSKVWKCTKVCMSNVVEVRCATRIQGIQEIDVV